MNMTKILATAAAVALLPIAGSAATLSLVGGTSGGMPTNFGQLVDINGIVTTPADLSAPITVFDNDDADDTGLHVASSGMVRVTLTYVGYEAANPNSASSMAAGADFFSTTTSFQGQQIIFDQAGGTGTGSLVDLIFSTVRISEGTSCNVSNGETNDAVANAINCQIGFSSIFNSGTSTYAMFGNGLGDSDLDDIVFRVDVSEVPVPAAGFLLVGGLGAMAALRRRKKA